VQIVCTERQAYSNSLASTGGTHSKHFPSSDIRKAPAGFRPKGCSRKSAQAIEEYGNLFKLSKAFFILQTRMYFFSNFLSILAKITPLLYKYKFYVVQ
jgi:hypothetical protein